MMPNIDYVYTDLLSADFEIQKRWQNKKLKQKVEQYIGEIPSPFQKQPKAVLFRNIMSPDHEFERFIELSQKTTLIPLAIEYVKDKFSTRNEDKICLLKMAIFEKRNVHQEAIFHYKTIADLQVNDNKKFSEITTRNGEYVTSFHHKLLEKYAPTNLERYDLSAWIDRNGHQAHEYYKKFFAFLICHAVLFESFVSSSIEITFENEVIFPAFEYIEKRFGMKPLITPLLPDITDKFWWCYPNYIL